VDISHEIPAFSIYAGAYAIDQAAPYFPEGTVHLVVVDPGVGTPRKPVAMAALGQVFIAPDNGVLSMVARRDASPNWYEISRSDLWLSSVSSTFHGRDVFAPSAAEIASGRVRPEELGEAIDRVEMLDGIEAEQTDAGRWRGRVLSVDRFGNVITNFGASMLGNLKAGSFRLEIGGREITEVRKTFGEARGRACFAYAGSSGLVEIGINRDSAARELGVQPGALVYLGV
jgi:S-adenosylmethionine hydrolase